MASVCCDPNGRKRILFMIGDGSRKAIHLGKATVKQAESVKLKVEQLQLAASGLTGVIDDETAKWLMGLSDEAYGKLADAGLVAKRLKAEAVLLGAYLQGYADDRIDVKPGTQVVYRHTRENLNDFFGPNKLLREITPGDADQWRLSLVKDGLSINTIARRSGIAKQFFRAAVRRRIITSNPFEDLKSSVGGNPERFYFVTRAEAQKVLDACPDNQWRLIFALCRYGGLRCPSEILSLAWQDINWAEGKMLVHSPKTEHHEGHESRLVPLFPELVPYLQKVFDEAETGSVYVITDYRKPNCNLRTQLGRIIKKAGLISWPKLFQNLRSTRETELAEIWPEHKVCQWIGNSKTVAREHYLQVTDADFKKAAGMDDTAHFAAHQKDILRHTESHREDEITKLDADRPLVTQCNKGMGRVGFEPT